MTEQIKTDKIEAAVAKERQRCIDIASEQYFYWRAVENDMILDFASGAMGASANIIARILNLTEKM
jgi:hypothetical protein